MWDLTASTTDARVPGSQAVLGTRTPPMHLHLGRISLQDWFGRGRPLQVTAPLPEHMVSTGRALGLSAKELAQTAADQGTEGEPTAAGPARMRSIRPHRGAYRAGA